VALKQLNSVSELLNLPIISEINFTDYQFLLYGVALVLMMLFRPEGLFPSQRRRRELHIAEELGDSAEAGDEFGASVLEDAQDTTR
jgi:branched-chain amino acid transport system permease protein